MKHVITVLFLIVTHYTFGQRSMYVKADNGLIIRAKPNKNSERIGKLAYGTAVEIIHETNIELNVKDGQESIIGKWVEIQEIEGHQTGFVFNGYLTSEFLKKRIEIKFPDLSIQMEIYPEYDEVGDVISQNDTARVYLGLTETPEGKKIKLKHSNFKKIEVFQRYENSITIMDEGPHCDLTEWKHYYSEWKKLEFNSINNSFVSDSYEEKDGKKFLDIDITELKKVVGKRCGDYWEQLIQNIKNVNEYPSGVTMSKIFLKILLTDENGSVTEKIIEFELPMGC